ncbi:uncharacterized protein LOC105696448 [Orussus abietinus]|uniref:uncharacterized protein LOC105696448 n=1 Tax=Orussus abietinus TaxID=222816 RepID=UPI00062543B1|nr:uncharacterized protein LOC105696448 [Orussus abietinus]
MAQNKNYCCIQGCYGSSGDHFFSFPRSPSIRQKWIEAIGANSKTPIPQKNTRICNKHFEKKFVLHSLQTGRARLTTNALPCLHLQIPTASEEEMVQRAKESNLTSQKVNTQDETINNKVTDARQNIGHGEEKFVLHSLQVGRDPLTTNAMQCSHLQMQTASLEETVQRVQETSLAPQKINTQDETINIKEDNDVEQNISQAMSPSYDTVNTSQLALTPREKKLLRQVKTLKQKVARRDNRIKSLKTLLQAVKYSFCNNSDEFENIIKTGLSIFLTMRSVDFDMSDSE